jgi:hypothetical protein
MNKKLLVSVFAILFSISSFTQVISESPNAYQSVQFKGGFNLGWDFPYATGAEISFLFSELIDINMGVGVSMSGTKVGIGTRIFPVRSKRVSPMIGAYLYHASGINNINVYVNNDEARYRISKDNALLLNAGMRFRFSKGHYLIAGLGYSFAFDNEKAVYMGGSRSSSVKSFADALAVGGFSLNVGILFKLNPGSYRNF